MKQLLTFASILLCLSASAQTKPDTAKNRVGYFYRISVSDFNQLVAIAEVYRRNVIYMPYVADKVKEQKQLDAYLDGLEKRVVRDSVVVRKEGKK